MRFIVCYDISDDKKRNRIAKILKAHGIRTQKSVFEIFTTREKVFRLLEEIEEVIDPIDKFFIYPVRDKYEEKIIRLGIAVRTRFENIY